MTREPGAAGEKVAFADALRGLASVAVLIAHYIGVFWLGRAVAAQVGYFPVLTEAAAPTPALSTWLFAIPYFNWGGFGVALFFLVSGFAIPFSLARFGAGAFLVARALRIMPTYAVGFGVSALALWISVRVYGEAFPLSLQQLVIHAIAGARDLFGAPVVDYVVWTLEIELKFYVVCALAAGAIRAGRLSTFLVPAAIFVLVMALDRTSITINPAVDRIIAACHFGGRFMTFMFIGTAVQFRHRGLLSGTAMLGLAAALFVAALIQWYTGPLAANFEQTWSWGAALGVFLLASVVPAQYCRNALFGFFAKISYPLYACHSVGGYVGMRLLAGAGVPPMLAIAIATAAAVALAYAIHLAVEAPTQKLARAVGERITARAPLLMRRPQIQSS